MLPSTSSIINRTVNTVTNAFVIGILLFITTFLMLLYRGLAVQFFVTLFADEYTKNIQSILSRVQYVIKSYIAGLLLEMIIIAVAYCSVFLFLGAEDTHYYLA